MAYGILGPRGQYNQLGLLSAPLVRRAAPSVASIAPSLQAVGPAPASSPPAPGPAPTSPPQAPEEEAMRMLLGRDDGPRESQRESLRERMAGAPQWQGSFGEFAKTVAPNMLLGPMSAFSMLGGLALSDARGMTPEPSLVRALMGPDDPVDIRPQDPVAAPVDIRSDRDSRDRNRRNVGRASDLGFGERERRERGRLQERTKGYRGGSGF